MQGVNKIMEKLGNWRKEFVATLKEIGHAIAQVRSCTICEQSGTQAGFLRVLRFPLPIFIPLTASHSLSSIIHGLYNRPISGQYTKSTVSPHPKKLGCFSQQHWMYYFCLFTLCSAHVSILVIVLSDSLCRENRKRETYLILKEDRSLVHVLAGASVIKTAILLGALRGTVSKGMSAYMNHRMASAKRNNGW
jgi:hypothetical protein